MDGSARHSWWSGSGSELKKNIKSSRSSRPRGAKHDIKAVCFSHAPIISRLVFHVPA